MYVCLFGDRLLLITNGYYFYYSHTPILVLPFLQPFLFSPNLLLCTLNRLHLQLLLNLAPIYFHPPNACLLHSFVDSFRIAIVDVMFLLQW